MHKQCGLLGSWELTSANCRQAGLPVIAAAKLQFPICVLFFNCRLVTAQQNLVVVADLCCKRCAMLALILESSKESMYSSVLCSVCVQKRGKLWRVLQLLWSCGNDLYFYCTEGRERDVKCELCPADKQLHYTAESLMFNR